jgi:Zn-dependent peptidase ImmA (M78 family)/DNA-binding XRE family transcriptional regulator
MKAVCTAMASTHGSEAAASDVAVLFDRHRLRVARELRGLSQVELAREVGAVRAASLSQFENGHARPSSATLLRLSVALRVPVAFFAAPARPDRSGVTNGFFRSLRSTPPRERQQALAFVELTRELSRQLEAFVRLPSVEIPRSQDVMTDATTCAEIESIAAQARAQWQIPRGPVDNMVRLLELHGIVTTRFHVGLARIDAFSVPFPDRPVVVLGADKNLRDRSRFDAAHELAHLVMHREDQAGNKIIEMQAHQFAAAFLMPANDIKDELPSRIDWPTLLRLKARWHVSIAALLKRARTLDVMEDRTYTQAMKTMSTRGWRKQEPGDIGPPESPILLRRAVEIVGQAGVPLHDLARRAGLPEGDINSILGTTDDDRPRVDF